MRTEDAPQFRVIMNLTWIQIVSDGSFEERGILWDDCESPSEVKQANRGDVQSINAITEKQSVIGLCHLIRIKLLALYSQMQTRLCEIEPMLGKFYRHLCAPRRQSFRAI